MFRHALASKLAFSAMLPAVVAGGLCSAMAAGGTADVGDAAPLFKLEDVHGRPVSIDGYRGAVVWLTFGPTW
jgi:hypothetical protein